MFSCRLVVRAIFPLYYLIAVCVGNDAVLKTLSNNVSLKVSLDNQTLYEFLPLSGEDGQSYPQNLTELQWNEQVLRAALVEANDGNSTSPASVQNGGLSGAIDYDGIHYFEDFSGAGQKVEESRVSTDVIRQIENYGVSHPEFYSLLTLSKCHCEGRRQVWTGTACVDHHSDTIIAVLDENFSGPEISKPLWYGSVVVAPVQCSDGFVKNVFRGGDFNLLMGTELLHSWTGFVFPEGSFCIEHILDENGELSWLAEACVPPPIVPLCCSENQRLSVGTKECVETNETNFFPPIYKENTTFSVIDTTFNNITCSEDEEKRWMKLSHDDSLVYSVSGVSFSWVGAGALPVVLMPSDYCVAAENDNNTYWASFCYKDAEKDHIEKCSNATCVRKCCNEGLFYDITTLNCYSPKEEEKSFLWVPTFHHLSSDGSRIQEDRPVDYVPVYGFPLGCQFFILEPGTQTADEFFLLSNGSLHVPVWEEPVPPTSYCVDNFMLDGEDPTERAMVCFPEVVQEQTSCEKVSKVLQPSLLLISCVFLAITLAVYAIVPELHAKVHGKSLLSHVSSLLVAYSSLVIVQWGSSILPMPWCISMASVIHISFLASFFWLNVMCFDIYWTLRSLRPIPESGEGSRSRFKWYSAYAWGCPLIVGLVTIGMQQIDANKHPELILPGFGVKKCWFAEQAALWLYFYGFVLLLTVINIIFFMQVAYILIQAQRVNKTILRNTRQDKDRMKLYVKLFVVMGVTWICEVISFQEGTCEVWMVTDIINSLQGVFIFIIFVCKRTVFQKLRTWWKLTHSSGEPKKAGFDGLRGKCDPGISRVKRIVRSTSSYATTSMSQRTTQISLDSMRGSSMNQSTLTAKSPNNSISNSGGNMQVIHETAVDSQLSETSANSRMEEKSPSSVHINGSPPAMVGDVVSARGGGGTDYPRTGAGVVSARGGGAVVQGETGMVSARGGLREEVTYQLPDEGLADDGPPSPNSMTVDVTVHDQQLLQQ